MREEGLEDGELRRARWVGGDDSEGHVGGEGGGGDTERRGGDSGDHEGYDSADIALVLKRERGNGELSWNGRRRDSTRGTHGDVEPLLSLLVREEVKSEISHVLSQRQVSSELERVKKG